MNTDGHGYHGAEERISSGSFRSPFGDARLRQEKLVIALHNPCLSGSIRGSNWFVPAKPLAAEPGRRRMSASRTFRGGSTKVPLRLLLFANQPTPASSPSSPFCILHFAFCICHSTTPSLQYPAPPPRFKSAPVYFELI